MRVCCVGCLVMGHTMGRTRGRVGMLTQGARGSQDTRVSKAGIVGCFFDGLLRNEKKLLGKSKTAPEHSDKKV